MQASGIMKLSTPVSMVMIMQIVISNYALTPMIHDIVILFVRNPRRNLTGNMTSPEPLPSTLICTTVLKVQQCVCV